MGKVGEDPQVHVRRGTHLQGDARVDDGLEQVRILAGAHAVPDARRCQGGHDLAHRGWSQELAPVGNAHQAGAARDAEGRCEGRRGADALVVGQTESDDITRTVPGTGGGQARERARVQGMLHP